MVLPCFVPFKSLKFISMRKNCWICEVTTPVSFAHFLPSFYEALQTFRAFTLATFISILIVFWTAGRFTTSQPTPPATATAPIPSTLRVGAPFLGDLRRSWAGRLHLFVLALDRVVDEPRINHPSLKKRYAQLSHIGGVTWWKFCVTINFLNALW